MESYRSRWKCRENSSYTYGLVRRLHPHQHEAGEGQGQQKHCYANPIKPEICIILSIAVMVFCKHRAKTGKSDSHLFSKDNVNHFGNLLRDILLDENLLPSTVDLGAA